MLWPQYLAERSNKNIQTMNKCSCPFCNVQEVGDQLGGAYFRENTVQTTERYESETSILICNSHKSFIS